LLIRHPKLVIPNPPPINALEFKPPSAKIPSFPPIVVPPSNLQRPAGVKAEDTDKIETNIPKVDIPILDIQMPLPEPAVVVTAVTTAVVAVATTTVAQTFFEPIQKHVKKQLQKRVDAWKKKRKEKKEKASLAS
tara:strand:+ start:9878 stop:10279 length:402 start_codon:yes stop_codon:yes gene_type:complete